MSDQITTAFKQQYTNNITMLQQQMHANLRNAVDVEQVSGEFTYFDQVAATSMTEMETRHGDTRYTDDPSSAQGRARRLRRCGPDRQAGCHSHVE